MSLFRHVFVFAISAFAISGGATTVMPAEESLPEELPRELKAAVDTLVHEVDEMPPHPVESDTTETTQRSSTRWIKQLINNGFHINDSTVEYPRFPRFLLKVYNWGDRTFNSYDPDYVVSTGKNWKLQGKSSNWMEALTLQFPDNPVWLHTHLYADAGVSLNFMAVSLSYFFNVNELLGVPTHRSIWNFDFTCSRFAVNMLWQYCSGDMTITRLGSYNDGHSVDIPFNNGDFNSFYIDAFYFFNDKRYSHAAAYCFSKYQLQSAGSWLAGFAYDTKDFRLDFSQLDIDIAADDREFLLGNYRFHYSDYQLMGGYAYNWALRPHNWTLNVTSLLSMGYRRSYDDSYGSQRNMLANGLRVDLGAVYNHRALFLAAAVKFRGGLFYTSQFIFFNYDLNFSATVGMRF